MLSAFNTFPKIDFEIQNWNYNRKAFSSDSPTIENNKIRNLLGERDRACQQILSLSHSHALPFCHTFLRSLSRSLALSLCGISFPAFESIDTKIRTHMYIYNVVLASVSSVRLLRIVWSRHRDSVSIPIWIWKWSGYT